MIKSNYKVKDAYGPRGLNLDLLDSLFFLFKDHFLIFKILFYFWLFTFSHTFQDNFFFLVQDSFLFFHFMFPLHTFSP